MSQSQNRKSRFFYDMVEHNQPQMAGLQEWLFQPGMLFNASGKWWGEKGARYTRHEGLDLYSFTDASGTIKTVNQHIKVPAAFAGEIVKIEPDFLGESIYISHEIFSAGGRQLISVYGHTVPREFLQAGQRVAAGEVIACISGFPDKKTSLVPHLHITFAWVPVPEPLDHLDWRNLDNDPRITLIDPLSFLSAFEYKQ
jgi:murein DD-endopeptidase MepM/ murein hydrolase activator NlpD